MSQKLEISSVEKCLRSKYSYTNAYYSNVIKDILDNGSSNRRIIAQDLWHFGNTMEFIKNCYSEKESAKKMNLAKKYYQYH